MTDQTLAGTLSLFIPSDAGIDEAVLELPSWYEEYRGRVSVKTPYATCIVHGKSIGTLPFMPGWPATHYAEVGEHNDIEPGEYRHPALAPDLLAIKPFGEPREFYRVEIDGAGVELGGF